MTQPSLECLFTPAAWLDETDCIARVITAFAFWLSVRLRHFVEIPLATLEMGAYVFAGFKNQSKLKMLPVYRLAFSFPVSPPQFAEDFLGCRDSSAGIFDNHPMNGFTRVNCPQSLAKESVQVLRGFGHGLREPLAGLNGPVQLLARQSTQRTQKEYDLICLMRTVIKCLHQLMDLLMWTF